MPTVILPYAGVLALLGVGLLINVIRLRARHKVDLGDGGVLALSQAIRAHGNFTENVPIALLVIFLLQLAGGSA